MDTKKKELLNTLFHSGYEKMFRYALAVLKDPDLAEDTVQEAFLFAVQQDDKLIDHPNPAGWLMNVLKYKIKETQRTQAHHAVIYELYQKENPVIDPGHQSAAVKNLLSEKYYMDMFRSVLSTEDYLLLKMVVLEGVDYKHAAHTLHISPALCRKRMERIRKKLKISIFTD